MGLLGQCYNGFVFQISLPHQNMLPPQFDHYCIIFNNTPQQVLMNIQDVMLLMHRWLYSDNASLSWLLWVSMAVWNVEQSVGLPCSQESQTSVQLA